MTGILLGPRFNAGAITPGTVAIGNDEVSTGTARWYIGADGFTYKHSRTLANRAQSWINPQAGMEQFEVMVTLAGDPLDVDAGTGVWLSCAGNHGWGYNFVGPAQEGSLTVEIRLAATGVVQDTATIDLFSEGTTSGI